MEIKGKIIKVFPLQTGTSKSGTEWQKREFIIEEDFGSYPNSLCITAFGERVAQLDAVSEGEVVRAHFDTTTREYNGRYYNNINLWEIVKEQIVEGAQNFTQASAPATPQESTSQGAEAGDGLPF